MFAADAKARRGQKAKAGVVVRMSQNKDCDKAKLLALLKTRLNKCRADTLALVLGRYRHRSKSHHFKLRMSRQRNRRKHDVADDRPVALGNQRNNRLRLLPQSVNKTSFR